MKLLLVDGSALLHRAYHAYPALTTKTGEVVGAVYGVASMLISAITEEVPTHIVVAWDLPQPTFRHKLFVGYKAQRPKADQEMVEQIPKVKEIIEVMGVKQLAKAGYEADDIIGTLAERSDHAKDTEVVILTGDQDTMQLVTPHVRVLTPAKGDQPAKFYDPAAVLAKYGVTPEQIVDYKALVGDQSDNIPGVLGIGPKTAAKLLNTYGSLENIYKSVDQIQDSRFTIQELDSKIKEKLIAGKDSALLSQELSRIVVDVPVGVTAEQMEYRGLHGETLKAKLEELGFKSLIRRIYPEEVEAKKKKVNENQMSLI